MIITASPEFLYLELPIDDVLQENIPQEPVEEQPSHFVLDLSGASESESGFSFVDFNVLK